MMYFRMNCDLPIHLYHLLLSIEEFHLAFSLQHMFEVLLHYCCEAIQR